MILNFTDPFFTTRVLGFEPLFDRLQRLSESSDRSSSYPPYNIRKDGNYFAIEVAVAGLTSKDIELRNLPKNTTGAIITKIENDSPINYLNINNIIIEAQKKKIKTVGDLKNIVNSALRSTDKTIMIGIYNNQNQKRYIGVKLDW